MGLLQKLKSALGMGTGGGSRQQREPDVTVERKPSAESERAVKTEDPTAGEAEPGGAPADDGPDDGPGAPDDGHDADGPAAESADDETAEDKSEAPEADSPAVEAITGIGATYAERLEAAGIETVADLADSDVETVAEAAQATESRVEDWLDQARNW